MDYYQICCKYRGRNVVIRDRFGRVHRGRITHVTRSHVYLAPFRSRNFGGFGYGYYGGWGFGAPYAIPLAFIVGFALGGLFF